MNSADFYTQTVDFEDLYDGVADKPLDPFDASADFQNLYVPDINQRLPFGTGYCTNSGVPFLVETGMYPSSICMPWFDGTESCEAIERPPDWKLAACHGRNFGNTMLLPPPPVQNGAPSIVPNIATQRGPGSTNALTIALRGNELQGIIENNNIKETDGGMPKVRRRPWTKEETQKLCELVEKFGTKNWAQIAENMPGRVGKQCRDRWNNHARPGIKKDKLTDEEEWRLIDAHDKIGPRWSQIAKIIPCRTENGIKNHWYKNLRKFKRGRNQISSIMKDYIMRLPAEILAIGPSATTTKSTEQYRKNLLENNLQLGENYDQQEGYAIENNVFQLGENYDNRVGYAIENNFQLGKNFDHRESYAIENTNLQLGENCNHQESYASENYFQLGETSERYMKERDGTIWIEQPLEMPEFQNLNSSGTNYAIGNPNSLCKEVGRANELPEEYTVREGQYNMEFPTTRDDNVNSECVTLFPSGIDSERGHLIPNWESEEGCSAWFDGI